MKRGDTVLAAYKVSDLAAAIGMHRKTLLRLLSNDGVPLFRNGRPWMVATHEFRRAYPEHWQAFKRHWELVSV